MKVCLHQFVRPSLHIHLDGVGNCTICTANEANKDCKNYYPINVQILEVSDGETQEVQKEQTCL